MKAKEIQVGCHYIMKVSGKEQKVRVLSIDHPLRFGKRGTTYRCRNMATGRECTARSASKFRRVAIHLPPPPRNPVAVDSMFPDHLQVGKTVWLPQFDVANAKTNPTAPWASRIYASVVEMEVTKLIPEYGYAKSDDKRRVCAIRAASVHLAKANPPWSGSAYKLEKLYATREEALGVLRDKVDRAILHLQFTLRDLI